MPVIMKMTFCIIQTVKPHQKYWLRARAHSAVFTGIAATFFLASMMTVSLHFEKQNSNKHSPNAAQIAITSTQAIWSSPKILTSGKVAETDKILPQGDRHIRVIESISRSCDERVIIADNEP